MDEKHGTVSNQPLSIKIGKAAKYHAENIGKQNAGKEVKVEFECAYIAFHRMSHGCEEI